MMRRLLTIAGVVCICLAFGACNNDFSLNGPREDVYVLNCIVRSDQSIQYAIISRNHYTENGGEPAPNSLEHNIKGATIILYNNDSVFVMRDTTVQTITSGVTMPVNCYFVKNITLIPDHHVRIEATLPDGTLLKSSIDVPNIHYEKFSWMFPQLLSSGYFTRPLYDWTWTVNGAYTENIFNVPQIEVYYRHNDRGTVVEKSIELPLDYGYVPVHPSFNNFCLSTLEATHQLMRNVAGEDPNKTNYAITKVLFRVTCLDPNTARYYVASEWATNEFTVMLTRPELSNIEGGCGCFGLTYKFTAPLEIDSLYVKSFGYRYSPL